MDAPTLITLNLSNALGCKSTLIFPVDIHASIQSNINTGVQLCRDVATVTNENFNKNLSYNWLPKNGLSNPNIGNPVITLNSSQIYSVKITNPETKCDTTISFSAIVKPFGADPGIDSLSTVCYNVGKQINPKFNNTLI